MCAVIEQWVDQADSDAYKETLIWNFIADLLLQVFRSDVVGEHNNVDRVANEASDVHDSGEPLPFKVNAVPNDITIENSKLFAFSNRRHELTVLR